jgi:hypothetical protein
MSLSEVIPSRFIPRILSILLMVAVLVALPACWVFSVEPFYEEEGFSSHPDPDLIFDPTLMGSWGQLDNDCLWILTISGDEKSYGLKMAPAPECKRDEKATEYVAHMVKVGNSRMLDVQPMPDEVCDLCMSLHTVFLVSREGDVLNFIPLDPEWLSQAITDKKVTLARLESHRMFPPVTLTASSKELKEFVRKYADDKAAFKANPDVKLKFKRR